METHSCKYCKSLVLRTKWSNAPYDNHCTLDSVDIEHIRQANEAQCPLFLLLLEKLEEKGKTIEDLMPYPSLYQRWDPSHTRDGRHLSLHLTKGLTRLCDGIPFKIMSPRSWVAGHSGNNSIYATWIDCEQLTSTLEATKLDTAPVNPDPETPETYKLVKSWINDCLDNHTTEHSRIHDTTFHPTRLLQIHKSAGDHYIILVADGISKSARYVAASYRWGVDQSHKMTRARFQENGCNIEFKNLPRTIRDAVKVTVELDYKFLWVDSLCIMQDDDADKKQEIAKMKLICSNAVVTIAAAVPVCSSEGFLRKRYTNVPVIEGITIEDERGQLHPGSMMEMDGSDPEVLPLSLRGWTLQEALLSARLLEYRPL